MDNQEGQITTNLKIYVGALFFVLCLIVGLSTSNVLAQDEYCDAGPNDYCIGYSQVWTAGGCGFNPPGVEPECYQRWSVLQFDCDQFGGFCRYSFQYPSYGCDLETCEISLGSPALHAGSCCVNVPPDDDDDTDDTTQDPAICGTVCGEGIDPGGDCTSSVSVDWEDTSICSSGNLSCSGWNDWGGGNCKRVCWGGVCSNITTDPWRGNVIGRVLHYPFPGSSATFHQPAVDDGVTFFRCQSANIRHLGMENATGQMQIINSSGGDSDWNCSSGGGPPAYETIAAADGPGPHRFTFTPPPGWDVERWYIDYPFGGQTPTRGLCYENDADGEACTAEVLLAEGDFYNHLQWVLKPDNDAPTATIDSPAPPNAVYIEPGIPQSFTTTARDTNGNLDNASLHLKDYDPATGTWISASWQQLGPVEDCSSSGSACTFSRTWTPNLADYGYWWLTDFVNDTVGWSGRPKSNCSGNPGDDPMTPPAGYDQVYPNFSNCGPESRLQVIVNNPPTGALTETATGAYISEINSEVGNSVNITVTGNDANAENSSMKLRLLRREFDPSTLTWSVSTASCSPNCWTEVSPVVDSNCTGVGVTSCPRDFVWNTVAGDAGSYIFAAEVIDEFGTAGGSNTQCTGDPGPADSAANPVNWPDGSGVFPFTNFSDCGAQSRMVVNVSNLVDVQGYIWDATDETCTVDLGILSANAISSSDVNGAFEPTMRGVTGTWDQAYATPDINYQIESVLETPASTELLCASGATPDIGGNFRYALKCLDGGTAGVSPPNCALTDAPNNPTTHHLGFEIVSSGWFATIAGDVFAGLVSPGVGISMGVPSDADVTGGFVSYVINGLGTLFTNGDASVVNSDGESRFSESNFGTGTVGNHVTFMDSTNIWPEFIDFNPPNNSRVVNLSGGDCNSMFMNLDPEEVYVADVSCVMDGLTNGNMTPPATSGPLGYRLSDDGVAVIYVKGDGSTPLRFDNQFRAFNNNPNRRIIFVSQVPIEIGTTDAVGDPLGLTDAADMIDTQDANIQALLLSRENITIETVGDVDGDDWSDDITIALENVIVGGAAGQTIINNRDRGNLNSYPSVMYIFNPIYMDALSAQEKASDVSNYTGLSRYHVEWSFSE